LSTPPQNIKPREERYVGENVSEEKNAPLNLEIANARQRCFWCTEAVFDIIKGVTSVEPGYTGGNVPNPSYDQSPAARLGIRRQFKLLTILV